MSTDRLLKNIHILKQRRKRSHPIIHKWLIDKQLEVISNCPLCECSFITVIANEDRYGANVRTGICNQCSLIFLIDQPSIKDYEDFYDKVYRPLVSAYLGREINAISMQKEQKLYAQKLIQTLYGQFTINDNLGVINIFFSLCLIGDSIKIPDIGKNL